MTGIGTKMGSRTMEISSIEEIRPVLLKMEPTLIGKAPTGYSNLTLHKIRKTMLDLQAIAANRETRQTMLTTVMLLSGERIKY